MLTFATQTDEAKADLGRLAEIRKQREQAAARRKAETDGKIPNLLFLHAGFALIVLSLVLYLP